VIYGRPTFTMTARRVMEFLVDHPGTTTVQLAQGLRLKVPTTLAAVGGLWGRAQVVAAQTGPADVWSLSEQGLEVMAVGLARNPRNYSEHLPRTMVPPPRPDPDRPATMAQDPADLWLQSLPKDAGAPARVVPTLVWLFDGSMMAARKAERGEHAVVLEGVTITRAGYMFSEVDKTYPYLVLREPAVTAMGPMVEEQEQSQ